MEKCKNDGKGKTMKKIILLMMMFLLIQSVLALYGGETKTIFEGDCTELFVNISIDPHQDESEYILIPNCTVLNFENNVKSFHCTCPDSKTALNLTPAINSVGNYTTIIEVYGLQEETTTTDNGNGGGGGGSSSGTAFSRKIGINKTITVTILPNTNSYLWLNGNRHTMRIVYFGWDWVVLKITSEPVEINISIGETKEVEIDDNILKIYLEKIRGRFVTLQLTNLEKEGVEPASVSVDKPPIDSETIVPPDNGTKETVPLEGDWNISGTTVPPGASQSKRFIIFFVITLALILVVGLIFYFVRRNQE